MKILLTILATGILLLYPFAVYFGLKFFSPAYLALFMIAILLVRIMLMNASLKKMPWLLPATILGIGMIVVSFLTGSQIGFKLYPLMVNAVMFVVFAYSYVKPPTVIETFARLTEKDFSAQAISYTAKVTLIWLIFFFFNGCVSLYTALFTSMETWLMYNGFIAYILMGILAAGEYLIRVRVKRHIKSVTQKS